MVRKRKTKESPTPQFEEQPYSFDLDTVLFLAELAWDKRVTVQKRMVEVATNKKCMPISLAKKVVKELGFDKGRVAQ